MRVSEIRHFEVAFFEEDRALPGVTSLRGQPVTFSAVSGEGSELAEETKLE